MCVRFATRAVEAREPSTVHWWEWWRTPFENVCLTAGRVQRSANVWLELNDCVCVHPRKYATLHTQFINSPNVCGAGICQDCDSNISHLLSLLSAFYSPFHTLFQPCWCLLQSVFLSLRLPSGSLSSFNVSHCLFPPFTQSNMSFTALSLPFENTSKHMRKKNCHCVHWMNGSWRIK